MGEYIVHIKRHCGWHTTTAEGDCFADAAVKAAARVHGEFGGNPSLYDVVFEERPLSDRDLAGPAIYSYAVFRWAAPHRIFDPFLLGGWGYSKRGDVNFSQRVREGAPGDCRPCGGTGVDFYNPFRSCRVCGEYQSLRLRQGACDG